MLFRRLALDRLSDLRRAIAERNAACVFAEPQFTSALVGTVTGGTRARAGVRDPLGAVIPEGKDADGATLRGLADDGFLAYFGQGS